MEAGIRERNRYKDISWLMPSIDLDKVFEQLGILVDHKSGDQIRAFCPDHHLFTGRKSSDANWTINTETGETFCFTEARGSNLVFTICRLLKKEPDDAAKYLTGNLTGPEFEELKISAVKIKASKIWKTKEEEDRKQPPIRGLDAIAKDALAPKMSERAYQFFIHPPGKKYPTNISRETVDRYHVFERTWGFYANRVVIPYFMRNEIVGFCAIDLMGKEAWVQAHPTQDDKQYRKVRYPENFQSTECLFGFDDCPKGAEYIIVTEGAREVMKLNQEGFPAVAILGAYISQTHRTLLSELHPKRIILMFDGDDAGVAITTRAANALTGGGVYSKATVQKCFVPRGRDPKTLDREALKLLVEKP